MTTTMRLVTLQAPANHGPSISVGGHNMPIVNGRVEVFSIYEEALKAHGFFEVGKEPPLTLSPVDQGSGALVPITYTTLVKVLKDLGVTTAESLPHDRLVGALVEAASRQTERLAHDLSVVMADKEAISKTASDQLHEISQMRVELEHLRAEQRVQRHTEAPPVEDPASPGRRARYHKT